MSGAAWDEASGGSLDASRPVVAYLAIRGSSGHMYVYRYLVVSPLREEGCGVACRSCEGSRAWYTAISSFLESAAWKYGGRKIELRMHFSHLAKGLFKQKLAIPEGVDAEVKYVNEKENLALKGIDKCLEKALAEGLEKVPAEGSDLYAWQREFLAEFGAATFGRPIPGPVFALSAPTGSGKSKAALEAMRRAAVMGIVATRTKTQIEAFIRDNERFGIGFTPVRLPNRETACIMLRMHAPPSEWSEEEKREYMGMLVKKYRCSSCPLNVIHSIDPKTVEQVVVEATKALRNGSDEQYVAAVVAGLQKKLGPRSGKRESVCAYSAAKNTAMRLVAGGTPTLVLGTYPHVLSWARSVMLEICTGKEPKDDKKEQIEGEKAQSESRPCVSAGVVLDEAHNIWRAVRDYNKYVISDERIKKVAKDLAELCRSGKETALCRYLEEKGDAFWAMADRLGQLAERNSKKKSDYVEIEVKADGKIGEELKGMLAELSGMLEDVCNPYMDPVSKELKDDVDLRIKRAYILLNTVKKFLEAGDGWGIYSYVDRKRKAFELLPIDLARVVGTARKYLPGPWLLLSGTIDEELMRRLFARDQRRFHWYSAPVKIGHLTIYFATSRDEILLTTKFDVGRHDEMYMRYAAAISRVLRGAEGPLRLVVYPSYGVMNAVASHYRRRAGGVEIDIWEESGEKSKRKVDEELERGRTVNFHVVAHGSFAEGVEFAAVRQFLKTIVVAGLPIPNIFNDYYVDLGMYFGYISDRCAEAIQKARDLGEVPSECRGEIIKWSYKLAEDTLRQIIGRAIRRPDDSATVYVLDTRTSRGYGAQIRSSLCGGAASAHYRTVKCADISAEGLLA